VLIETDANVKIYVPAFLVRTRQFTVAAFRSSRLEVVQVANDPALSSLAKIVELILKTRMVIALAQRAGGVRVEVVDGRLVEISDNSVRRRRRVVLEVVEIRVVSSSLAATGSIVRVTGLKIGDVIAALGRYYGFSAAATCRGCGGRRWYRTHGQRQCHRGEGRYMPGKSATALRGSHIRLLEELFTNPVPGLTYG